jgi:hypothetical protein
MYLRGISGTKGLAELTAEEAKRNTTLTTALQAAMAASEQEGSADHMAEDDEEDKLRIQAGGSGNKASAAAAGAPATIAPAPPPEPQDHIGPPMPAQHPLTSQQKAAQQAALDRQIRQVAGSMMAQLQQLAAAAQQAQPQQGRRTSAKREPTPPVTSAGERRAINYRVAKHFAGLHDMGRRLLHSSIGLACGSEQRV